MSLSYRTYFREHEMSAHYKGGLHLFFMLIICISIIGICIATLDFGTLSIRQMLTVPMTFLYANLVEYFAHRYPMHHKYKGFGLVYKRHTGQHHRFFDEENMVCDSSNDYKIILFPPVLLVFFLLGFALPLGLVFHAVLSPNIAKLFLATAVFYYLNYELLHLSYHLPQNHIIRRLPLVNTLSRLHTIHHKSDSMQQHNFNITYPIFDIIFGTYKK